MIFWRILRHFYEDAADEMVEMIKTHFKKGERVLDLGCGSGVLGKKIQEKFQVRVLGIDIVDERIEKINFQKYNGENIPFPDGFFDTVLISFVLHHTKEPLSLLKEAQRVGKKIIIFEDLPEQFFDKVRCFFHWFFWNLFARKFTKFNFFTEREWEKIFSELNLKILEKKDFFPKYWCLDPVKRKVFVLKR